MNSDKLLEDLESLVMNASKVPFTNKKMIEEEELLQLIDDLKESMHRIGTIQKSSGRKRKNHC